MELPHIIRDRTPWEYFLILETFENVQKPKTRSISVVLAALGTNRRARAAVNAGASQGCAVGGRRIVLRADAENGSIDRPKT